MQGHKMQDIIKMSQVRQAGEIVGKITLDLTDPTTNKVTERIEEYNTPFRESILGSNDWVSSVSTAKTCLCDDDRATNLNAPFVFGNGIGYGAPSQASSGLLRGAFNSAEQLLAAITPMSVRWVFRYDFTAPQAVGTIKNVGLTRQYQTSGRTEARARVKSKGAPTVGGTSTQDGRYAISISSAGIITLRDCWFGVNNTIDVSATVGNKTANGKAVAYDHVNKKYYVAVYSATAAERVVYRFSDITFSTLEATILIPGYVENNGTIPAYVHNNKLFMFLADRIRIHDLSTDTRLSDIGRPTVHNLVEGPQASSRLQMFHSTIPFGGRYCLCGNESGAGYGDTPWLPIFDMQDLNFPAMAVEPYNVATLPHCYAPYADTETPFKASGAWHYTFGAFTNHVLSTPVPKPDNKGLTVKYELEVFWE